MALKRKINKETYEKLSDEMKTIYTASGDDYVLDAEDAKELKNAKDQEKQRAKDLQTELDSLRAKLEAIEDEKAQEIAKKTGDLAALEKSWKEKAEKEKEPLIAENNKLRAAAVKSLVDGTAGVIAQEIATVPSLMARAIKDRLTVDFDGDEPTLRVLGPDGKPSALTIDDLKKEFVANKDYSAIIVGSKATGSSASKQTSDSRAFLDANGKKRLFTDLSEAEQISYIESKQAAKQKD